MQLAAPRARHWATGRIDELPFAMTFGRGSSTRRPSFPSYLISDTACQPHADSDRHPVLCEYLAQVQYRTVPTLVIGTFVATIFVHKKHNYISKRDKTKARAQPGIEPGTSRKSERDDGPNPKRESYD